MTRRGKTLKQEENRGAPEGPTKIMTAQNRHSLNCSACDGLCYVDESTYSEFMHAMEYDASENRFFCEGCTEEQAEDEHSSA